MSTYLSLTAKPGCEDQINHAYARELGHRKFLVYTVKVIREEITYINESPDFRHLHGRLKNIRDWEEFFPSLKPGTGCVPLAFDEDDAEAEARATAEVGFVLSHRMLFEAIDNLDDARDAGLTDFPGDLIRNHKSAARDDDTPSFANLPKGRSRLYRRCVEYNRPDLWAAYLAFTGDPSPHTWGKLRTKVIPWAPCALQALWPLVENLATAKDGQSFGLYGRFRDEVFPSVLLINHALAKAYDDCVQTKNA